jgi:hypothetical protein
LDRLQEMSVALTITIAILGGLGWLYTICQNPDLTEGKYFESAWLDIKDSQLTLYVEFIPDGHGRSLLAVTEAVCRVKEKSWINPAIDGRPIVVILMVRENTVLVPISAVVIYSDFKCDRILNTSLALKKAARNMTFLKDNGTISIVNRSTGEHEHLNISEFSSPAFLETVSCVPTVDATAIFKYQ